MSENKITRANIKISFGTSSGFSSQAGYKSQNSDAVLDAANELAHLLRVEGRLSELEKVIAEMKEADHA